MTNLLIVTGGPFKGETGYYAGPAEVTEYEIYNVYPIRTVWLTAEDSEREFKVAPEHLEELE